MERLNTEKLYMEFRPDVTTTEPIIRDIPVRVHNVNIISLIK